MMRKHRAEQFNLFPNMRIENERYPAFNDDDTMSFGKHKGEYLMDVPASYFKWLWLEMDYNLASRDYSNSTAMVADKVRLANYIWNSKEALEEELKDSFI